MTGTDIRRIRPWMQWNIGGGEWFADKNVRYGNPSRSGITVGSRLPKRVDGRLMLGEGSNTHPNLVGEFDAVRVSKGVLDPSQFLGRVPKGLMILFR